MGKRRRPQRGVRPWGPLGHPAWNLGRAAPRGRFNVVRRNVVRGSDEDAFRVYEKDSHSVPKCGETSRSAPRMTVSRSGLEDQARGQPRGPATATSESTPPPERHRRRGEHGPAQRRPAPVRPRVLFGNLGRPTVPRPSARRGRTSRRRSICSSASVEARDAALRERELGELAAQGAGLAGALAELPLTHLSKLATAACR